MNGVINFCKPPGMSSAQAVAFVKRLTGWKSGHAGTLDPEAAGVLPILVGRATRISDYVMGGVKEYLAEIAFGIATDTQDGQGRAVARSIGLPDRNTLAAVLKGFTGAMMQTPPDYSAKKTGGETAYRMARKGVRLELSPRQVNIRSITLVRQMERGGFLLRVSCGKGTYIRTLCHDIGTALDCPAHMRFLIRERSGTLCLSDAVTAEGFGHWADSGKILPQRWFVDIKGALGDMPCVQVNPTSLARTVHGMSLASSEVMPSPAAKKNTTVCICAGEKVIGVYQVDDGLLVPRAILTDQSIQ